MASLATDPTDLDSLSLLTFSFGNRLSFAVLPLDGGSLGPLIALLALSFAFSEKVHVLRQLVIRQVRQIHRIRVGVAHIARPGLVVMIVLTSS